MRGGHSRKTVAEHIRDATFRPARHLKAAGAAAGHAPKRPPACPKDLTGDARKLWRVIVAELAGVIGPLDGPSLALLCVTHAELMRGAAKLATLDPGSEDHARLSRTMRAGHETYARLAERFGLTPVDRERLPVQAAVKEEDDVESRRAAKFGL